MSKRLRGFRMTTICSLLLFQVMRFIWMPYTGEITLDWQFHLVRWVFYAIALGAANLFFVMSLTGFRFDAVRVIVLPMGIRIALDGLIFLSASYLGLISFSLRYLFDILFLVLSGIFILSRDRKSFVRGAAFQGKAARILLYAAALCAIAMIVILQASLFRVAEKYVKDSASYNDAIRYHMVQAYAISLTISFLVQYALVLFAVDHSQVSRLRSGGFFHYMALSVLIAAAFVARLFLYPMYIASGGSQQGWELLDRDKKLTDVTAFFQEASYATFERNYFVGNGTFTEGETGAIKLLDSSKDRSISFGVHDAMDHLELTIDGNKVHTYLPYALLFVDGQEQYLLKGGEIATTPENGTLTRILEQGILQNDYSFFEYGGEYLLKYDPEFITPYIERFSRGEFAEKGPTLTGDFRPEYIIQVAKRMMR